MIDTREMAAGWMRNAGPRFSTRRELAEQLVTIRRERGTPFAKRYLSHIAWMNVYPTRKPRWELRIVQLGKIVARVAVRRSEIDDSIRADIEGSVAGLVRLKKLVVGYFDARIVCGSKVLDEETFVA